MIASEDFLAVCFIGSHPEIDLPEAKPLCSPNTCTQFEADAETVVRRFVDLAWKLGIDDSGTSSL